MASEVYDETSTYSCDKTFDETLEKPSMFWGAIHILHRILVIFIRIVAVLFFGGHGDAMPDICDPILLESAVSIAEKIRTEQVSSFFHQYISTFLMFSHCLQFLCGKFR